MSANYTLTPQQLKDLFIEATFHYYPSNTLGISMLLLVSGCFVLTASRFWLSFVLLVPYHRVPGFRSVCRRVLVLPDDRDRVRADHQAQGQLHVHRRVHRRARGRRLRLPPIRSACFSKRFFVCAACSDCVCCLQRRSRRPRSCLTSSPCSRCWSGPYSWRSSTTSWWPSSCALLARVCRSPSADARCSTIRSRASSCAATSSAFSSSPLLAACWRAKTLVCPSPLCLVSVSVSPSAFVFQA